MVQPQQTQIPLPDTGGLCLVTSIPGSAYVTLEFQGPGRVPGRLGETPFKYRLKFPLTQANHWRKFFGEECPKQWGQAGGLYPARLNPPGHDVELVVWLTVDQAQTIGEGIARMTRLAGRRLTVVNPGGDGITLQKRTP